MAIISILKKVILFLTFEKQNMLLVLALIVLSKNMLLNKYHLKYTLVTLCKHIYDYKFERVMKP